MTATSGVSFLGQSTAQSERLSQVQVQMDTLEQQASTQKNFQTMSGLGSSTQFLLQLHDDSGQLTAYNSNITDALNRINIMNSAMTSTANAADTMANALETQPGNGNYDMTSINTQAQQLLGYVTDLTNTNIGGTYLFAGTDTQNAPMPNTPVLTANMQAQVTGWLNGSISTAQFMTNIDGFVGTQLGLSPTISSATDATVQVDKGVNLAYGAIADRSGASDVTRVLAVLAVLKAPNPATDVPTSANLDAVIGHLTGLAQAAQTKVQGAQTALASKLTLVNDIQATHTDTLNTYTTMLAGKENADTATVVTELQSLSTQLNASYEVTKMMSQLSLVNFLTTT